MTCDEALQILKMKDEEKRNAEIAKKLDVKNNLQNEVRVESVLVKKWKRENG